MLSTPTLTFPLVMLIPQLSIPCCTTTTATLAVTERHRRRIKTEEKAKVVASVCGKEFIQFLAALAVLHWKILNYMDE